MTVTSSTPPSAPPPIPPLVPSRARRIVIKQGELSRIEGIIEGEAKKLIYFNDQEFILLRDKERYVMYVPSTPTTNSIH